MTIVGMTLLMSTNSLSSVAFPNPGLGRKPIASNTMPMEYFRKFTQGPCSIGRDGRRRRDFGEALEDGARAVFRNIETQLHAGALDFHFRRLNKKEQVRIG